MAASRASDSVDTVSMNEAPTVGTIQLRKTVTTRPSHSARAIDDSTSRRVPPEQHQAGAQYRRPSHAGEGGWRPCFDQKTRVVANHPRHENHPKSDPCGGGDQQQDRDSASWSSKKRATDTIPVPITTAPGSGGDHCEDALQRPAILVARFDGISKSMARCVSTP